MDINIRDHIRKNFKNSSMSEIEDSISSSLQSKEEVILPGLGVFFEILWQNIDEKEKEKLLEILMNNL